jgi:hypothetical protein
VLQLLLPPLIILLMAGVNLWGLLRPSSQDGRSYTSSTAAVLITLFLLGEMLLSSTHLDLKAHRGQTDQAIFRQIARLKQSDDLLLAPFSDPDEAQAFATHLVAYLDYPLSSYVWLEGKDKTPVDWSRLWLAATNTADRIWLLESALRRTDPLGSTVAHLNADAFPSDEIWLDENGRLSLYLLPDISSDPVPLNVPFEAGLTLINFALLSDSLVPGDMLKVRLTWQMTGSPAAAAPTRIVAFAHLLTDTQPAVDVAQRDQLLVNLVESHQSPLLPGQTIQQGYALSLPADLPPGSYSIIVGLYDADTVRRLFRTDGSPDDFLYLTTVGVSEP